MDEKLIKDFLDRIKNKDNKNMISDVYSTINSHITAFAGEFASVSESVVDVNEFFNEAIKMTKSIEKLFE